MIPILLHQTLSGRFEPTTRRLVLRVIRGEIQLRPERSFWARLNGPVPSLPVCESTALKLLGASRVPCPHVGTQAAYGRMQLGWRSFDRSSGEDVTAVASCTVCGHFDLSGGSTRFRNAFEEGGDQRSFLIHPHTTYIQSDVDQLPWTSEVGFDFYDPRFRADTAPGQLLIVTSSLRQRSLRSRLTEQFGEGQLYQPSNNVPSNSLTPWAVFAPARQSVLAV